MFLVTDRFGVVRYANRSVIDKTGFSLAQMVGKRPGDLWGGHMDEGFYQTMWRTIKTKKQPFSAQLINRTYSGDSIEQEMFFAPVLEASGGIEFFIEMNPRANRRNGEVFESLFLEKFSDQTEHREYLPRFITEWLFEARSPIADVDVIDFIQDVFVDPVKRKFQNRTEDKALIEQAKENPEAFRLLYKKYFDEIREHFSHRVNSEAAAHDLTQDVFLNAFRYLDSFKITNASYRTYLMRIAHNTLVNYYRDKTDGNCVDIDDAPLGVFGVSDERIDPWMRKRLRDAMSEALTGTQMQIFKMKYFDGLLVREIATILQTSENAVKLHLHRGRKRIRAYLDEE
jgi:RNA polymerase sigma-70 factor (ECF subfamily)